jgi:hypothetical protein
VAIIASEGTLAAALQKTNGTCRHLLRMLMRGAMRLALTITAVVLTGCSTSQSSPDERPSAILPRAGSRRCSPRNPRSGGDVCQTVCRITTARSRSSGPAAVRAWKPSPREPSQGDHHLTTDRIQISASGDFAIQTGEGRLTSLGEHGEPESPSPAFRDGLEKDERRVKARKISP